MPDDKPNENLEDRSEKLDSTPLSDAGNSEPRPPEKQGATEPGKDLQNKGLLPDARIEVAPGVKPGDQVRHGGEEWTAKGKHEGKSVLYQEGRGRDFAGNFKTIEGAPDPNKYKELPHFDGQPKDSRYYADASGRVFKVSDMGNGKSLMSTAHDVALVDPKVIAVPDKAATPVKPADTTTGDKGAKPEARPDGPRLGDKVDYKGEKLKVAGFAGGHALLHESGRNADYAVMMEPVTDAQLKSKFQEIKVTIDGKQESRYIQNGHPERGVYELTNFGGQKSLYLDHAFETIPKSELAKIGKPETRTTGTGPERQSDKPADIKPGDGKPVRETSPTERAPDAELRPGKYGPKKEAADERVRTIDGKEVKVRTPQEDFGKAFKREVEIDGKKIELTRRAHPQQWYYSEMSPVASANKGGEQVKLHVTGISANDMARLQAELLPKLEEMRLKGDVSQYKTHDPNFMDGKWKDDPAKYGKEPGPTGQNSKVFTIYVPPEKAQEVAKAIDKILKEKGLTLENFKGENAGELTRKQSESQRVSVERDMWTLTQDKSGRDGALIDESLAKKIHEKYSASHGVDAEGRLSNDALRAAEKAAGIKEGQLTYDKDGRMMFNDANHHSDRQDSNRFYLDESKSSKEHGRMTGRPALYALYATESMDPAKIYTDEVRAKSEALAKAQARPERVAPTADPLRGTDTRVGSDGTLDRREARPGEVLAREKLNAREHVEQKEIDAMKTKAEELAKSEKATEREQAEALRKTVAALEGRLGVEAQEHAHRAVLAESKRALERGEGGGYGRAITGGLIGIGILAGAALAYYRSTQKEAEQKALERARVK